MSANTFWLGVADVFFFVTVVVVVFLFYFVFFAHRIAAFSSLDVVILTQLLLLSAFTDLSAPLENQGPHTIHELTQGREGGILYCLLLLETTVKPL